MPEAEDNAGSKAGEAKNAPTAANGTILSTFISIVGVIGTLVTITLTVYNAHTKNEIDAAEGRLKERTAAIEESKERVARYGWVRTLFPDLEDKDQQKRTFTLALMGLALNEAEAKKLFAGLSTSDNKDLQQAGQAGLANIKTEAVSQLVSQLNADAAEDRKAAVASLIAKYSTSSFAISASLDLLQKSNATTLSQSGRIDALYYLGRTDPTAWSKEQADKGRAAIEFINSQRPGAQTQQALQSMKSVVDRVQH